MNKPRIRKDHNPKYKLKTIMQKTIKNNDCLEWLGNYFHRLEKDKHKPMYPYMYYKAKPWRGNRLVLFLSTGKLPKNKLALHKCDNTKCINPKHLYWGTHIDNVRDAYLRNRARNSKVTHCLYGHEYSGWNLRYDEKRNKRYCRICAWYKRRKLMPKIETPKKCRDFYERL